MIKNKFAKDRENIITINDKNGNFDVWFRMDETNSLVAYSGEFDWQNMPVNSNYILLSDYDPDGLLQTNLRDNFNKVLAKTINHYHEFSFDVNGRNNKSISKAESIINDILSKQLINEFYFISGYFNTLDDNIILVHVYSDVKLSEEIILSIETIIGLTL